jgi:hypothetical protein
LENKPIHYDGSVSFKEEDIEEIVSVDGLEITDEIRKNIGGNPYIFE